MLMSVVGSGLAALVGSGGGGGGAEAPPTPPPQIVGQPQALTVDDGAPATFSVTASGAAIGYQWQRNGLAIAGATSASLTLAAASLADHGSRFRVVVSNAGGTVSSEEAVLSVRALAPAILTQPVAATVFAGQTATFAVVAGGSAPLTYQWRRNGVDIGGATAASYTTPALVTGDSGATFSVHVSNPQGATDSNAVALTVQPVPTAAVITTQPQPVSVVAGQGATFAVVAAGSPPLSYQWRRDGVNIPGATAASYTIVVTQSSDHGARFSVVVDNPAQQPVTSAAALLTVQPVVGPAGTRLGMSSTTTVVLRADGSLVGWGDNTRMQLGAGALVAGTPARAIADGVVAFSLSESGGLALKPGGAVVGWGTNDGGWLGGALASGQAPVWGTPAAVGWPRAAQALSAGSLPFGAQPFSFVLLDNASVWFLPGDRTISGTTLTYAAAQVAGLFDITGLAQGHGEPYAIRQDGTVWRITMTSSLGSGPTYFTGRATQVSGLSNVRTVTCGTRHCLALLHDGTVRAWGEGRSGELGHGSFVSSDAPVTVSGLTQVTHIAVTSVYGSSLARTADGRVWSWGRGELSARPPVRSGALTLPPANVAVPTEVTSLAATAEIGCSDRHCAARRSDGTVWTWGNNLYRQLGNGTLDAQEPVPVPGIQLN